MFIYKRATVVFGSLYFSHVKNSRGFFHSKELINEKEDDLVVNLSGSKPQAVMPAKFNLVQEKRTVVLILKMTPLPVSGIKRIIFVSIELSVYSSVSYGNDVRKRP